MVPIPASAPVAMVAAMSCGLSRKELGEETRSVVDTGAGARTKTAGRSTVVGLMAGLPYFAVATIAHLAVGLTACGCSLEGSESAFLYIVAKLCGILVVFAVLVFGSPEHCSRMACGSK